MKIVVALGGNALGKSPQEQKELVKKTAKPIVDLIEDGNEVIVSHGNGPQVGMINLAFSDSNMPFPECGAMSQGYIGYHLQNAIREELLNRNINKPIATILTQVVVDKDDNAFKNPTKPIGQFYTEDEANKIKEEKNYVMKEDAGRGFRRVVASPLPVDIVEKDIIKTLINDNKMVIAVGGGGVPVIKEDNHLEGVAAVIDKDFASAKLAELVDADYLIILTAVKKVSINFNKPDQKDLDKITIKECDKYIEEGHFAAGSMLPKVIASKSFVESKPNRKALITSLECAVDGIKGLTGTVIYND